jgi:ribonucleotide reductase alpha subunit
MLGYDIWNRKYRWENESFDQWLDRVSNKDEDIKKLIVDKKFLFGGRVLANYNTENSNVPSNCFVGGYVGDSIKEIMEACTKASLTFKKGGGIGFNLSKIRPKGSSISDQNGWKSEGVIPFMELLDQVTKTISQNGRRGALSLILEATHPDIVDFIKVKEQGDTKITSANLSVIVDDEFMEHVKECSSYKKDFVVKSTGEIIEHIVNAPMIYNLMMEKAHKAAEPGILYWDTMKKNHLGHAGKKDYEIEGNNPCYIGSTQFLTKNGFVRLDETVGKEVEVWNGFEWSKAKPKITGVDQEIVELHFSKGQILKCTLNHKFYIKRGREKKELEVEAKDLMIGDRTIDCLLPSDCKFEGSKVEFIIKNGEIAEKVYCFDEPRRHAAIFNGVYTGQCMEVYGSKDTACNLASINVSAYLKDGKFEGYKLRQDTIKIFKALDKVIDYAAVRMPVENQKINAEKNRNMGLGVMGVADLFIKLGVKYGSKDSIEKLGRVMEIMYEGCIEASMELARDNGTIFSVKELEVLIEKGLIPSPLIEGVREFGLRNISMLSIAPTGSISNLLGISGGIEPVFKNKYQRKTESLHGEDVYYTITHKSVEEEMNKNNGIVPEYCVTSDMIEWKNRIDLQAAAQKYVDLAISSTVNLPKETTIEEIKDLYMYAWEKGLKGVTIYRDGSLEGILNDIKNDEENEEIKELVRGEMAAVPADTYYIPKQLTHGCGSIKVMIGYSESKNKVTDVYVIPKMGSGCTKNITGEAILISQVLRLGGDLRDIKQSVKGIEGCTSCVTSRLKGREVDGTNCPNILIDAVIAVQEQMVYNENTKVLVRKSKKNETKEITNEKIICPVCGEKLNPIGGCWTCTVCSFSHCD